MSPQTYKTNEGRITTERNIERAFPDHLDFPSNHGGLIGSGAPPFNQRQHHNPTHSVTPNFVPARMTNLDVVNYDLTLNNQCLNPNPQPYPHPRPSSTMPMPNNYEPNIPAAMNIYPRQPQIWTDNGRTITAQEKIVQEVFARRTTQLLANTCLTKNTIGHEPHQSQKPTSYMTSPSIIMTKNELEKLQIQNKLHTAAVEGEPITNDATQTKPASDPPNMPAPMIQNDKNNHDKGNAIRQGEESKFNPLNQSLPLNRTEDKKNEKEGITVTKNRPSKSPPIVIGEATPLELLKNIDKRSVAFAFKIGSKKSERCANAAESKWINQQSLEDIVTCSHQPANISSSCFATENKPKQIYNTTPPIEVFNGPAPELPPGWTLQKLQRTGGVTRNRIDKYWYSPTKKRFRSTVEIKKFMTALEMTKGDEEEAFELFKAGSIVI